MLWKELDGRFIDPAERYLCHAGGGIVAEPGINVLPDVFVGAAPDLAAGGALAGALGAVAPLELLAAPLDALFGDPFGLFSAPLSGVPSIVGPIAQSLGLPATTTMAQLTGDIAAAGFSPQQIGAYLQQNLPQLASIMQEGQPQALGEILSSGLLGQQTTAVGSEFAPQLEQAAVASGQVSPGDAVQFLQAFGDITPQAAAALTGGDAGAAAAAATPALAPTDVQVPLPTVDVTPPPPPMAQAGGPAGLLGSVGSGLSSVLNAVNPIGTAMAQDVPNLVGGNIGGSATAGGGTPTVQPEQNFGQPQGATPSGINLPSVAGGGGAGAGTSAAATGLSTPSNLGVGGALTSIGATPTPAGVAPIELTTPDLSGVTSGGGTGGVVAAAPAPPPTATGPVGVTPAPSTPTPPATSAAPSAVAQTTPPTPPSAAPSDGLTATPGYSNVAASTSPPTPYSASGDYVSAPGTSDSGGWFSDLKGWLKDNSGLLTAGGLGISLLSALFGNKLPQQASSATQAANSALGPTGQAFTNANLAQGPANQAFQAATLGLLPAATANLAQTEAQTQPLIQSQTDQAIREQQAAIPLLNAETTGQLPPGTADAIRQALATSRAGIASGYGNLNLAGSTSEAQDIAASSGNIIAQIPGILSGLVNQGIQMGQGATQSTGEALSGMNTVLQAVQGLSNAIGTDINAAGGVTNAAGGVTNAANANTNAAQVASNANLNFADLQIKADQELQTALAQLSRNLALSQMAPSTVNVTA